MDRRWRGPVLAAIVVAAILAGPVSSALRGHVRVIPGHVEREYVPLTTDEGTVSASVVAEAKGSSIAAYAEPDLPQPEHTFSNPTEDGQARVFLVVGRHLDWVQVLLPVRPNETAGWVRMADVSLKTDRYRVDVELRGHRVSVWDGANLIVREPAGVGKAVTSTPKGVYFLTSLLQPPDPGGIYGPYAFGTSAFSDVLNEFAGGNGVIGIHGTNEPAAVGHEVSHGCIRLRNDVITKLAGILPLGTPVFVRP